MADIVFEDGDVLVDLVIDVTKEERHRASAQATEHPVERGVSISDHVRPERDVLSLDIVITDTPLFFAEEEERLTRVHDVWEQLIDARDRALLATVTTAIRTYEEMVLIEATTTRRSEDGTWMHASLTFAEIRRVSTELVDDPLPARAHDQNERSRGSQSTEEAAPRLRSAVVQVTDFISSAFGGG